MKYFNVHLYDSRRRSLTISIFVVLFVFLTLLIITGVIFFKEKEKFNDKLEIFIRSCLLVHHIIPCILHFVASILVLIDLIKHQRKFKVNHGVSYLIFGTNS
jgi:cytochrome b subunit of formate dehydrogenase